MDAKFLAMDGSLLSEEQLRRLVSDAVLAAESAYRVGADADDVIRSQLLQRQKHHTDDYILVRVRGQLAGFCCFYRDGGVMELHDLYILPEHRCCGLGTALLHRCISSTELPIQTYLYDADLFTASLFGKAGFRREASLTASVSRWRFDNCDPF